MARIGAEDRAALRSALPQLLRTRLGVEDTSRAFRCPDPNHEDRHPSAHYYAGSQVVKCFSCGGKWDSFSLIGMLGGIEGFRDQARAVADAVGYRLGCKEGRSSVGDEAAGDGGGEVASGDGIELSEACFAAYDRLYTTEGDVGRRWLRSRGLGDDDIVRHGLGFVRRAPDLSPRFRAYEPEAFGFLVIPFWDEHCDACTYAMLRTVPREGATARVKEWRPKGLESQIWRGWALGTGLEAVYVTEGLVDAMALAKLTGRECVALGGTPMAGRFVRTVKSAPAHTRPRRVVVCMDGDGAGENAAEMIAKGLDGLGVPHVSLPEYPNGAKDADEWLMCLRGDAWDFDEAELGDGLSPLTTTRWEERHG